MWFYEHSYKYLNMQNENVTKCLVFIIFQWTFSFLETLLAVCRKWSPPPPQNEWCVIRKRVKMHSCLQYILPKWKTFYQIWYSTESQSFLAPQTGNHPAPVSNFLAGCYEKSKDSFENIRCQSACLEMCPAILSRAKFLRKSTKDAVADFIIINVLFWSVNKCLSILSASVEGFGGCRGNFGVGSWGSAPDGLLQWVWVCAFK